jgi:hypothetical protein
VSRITSDTLDPHARHGAPARNAQARRCPTHPRVRHRRWRRLAGRPARPSWRRLRCREVLRRFLKQAAMALLLAGISKARIRRLRVDRVGDADDRHPTRHDRRDLADSLERVLRLGGAVVAEQDAPPRRRSLPHARRRMHVDCHRRRYDVATARARGGAAPASAAPCWISRTRNASTMSLTPRISANAATQATSRRALRP